jgi:DNA replication and repair protein RecF
MKLVSVSVRDFRSYEHAEVSLGNGVTVIWGPNGAGKTNLLEALYFGCTGRSCRTTNEREVVRFGASSARVVVSTEADDGQHELSVGFAPAQPKRMRVDGATVERLLDVPGRPLISVFLPDRLELIKAAPSVRRAHLDQFVAAMWPSRRATRRAYAQTLAQRNALLLRVRSGYGSRGALASWDAQLARHGIELMRDRADAVAAIADSFGRLSVELGLNGEAAIAYRPRSPGTAPDQLAAELRERREGDLERGFTGHGPHRDELATSLDGRDLRSYGSQGQQRLALLALLLAERDAIGRYRDASPVMLLDDVMSELDRARREALVGLLRNTQGQSVITTTDPQHVPGASDPQIARIAIADGRVLQEALA